MEIQGDSVTVDVSEGLLRGSILTLSDNLGGKRYLSFKGIPYGQPPVGNLRFKPLHMMKLPFLPVSEGQTKNAFLPYEPKKIMRNGNFNLVPIMIGGSTLEGLLILLENLLKLLYDKPEKKKEIVDKLRLLYLKGKPISMETLPSLINAANGPPIPGPCHADDIGYIFRNNKFSPEPEPNSTEFKVMNNMVEMWTNFASSGNPSKNLNITWPKYNQSQQFLKIGSSLSIEIDFFKERLEFWKKINKEAELYIF